MTSILDRDTLNAFCRHTHAEVSPTGQGPLSGLTCGIKDLYDIAGHKTGYGSPDWFATHEPATTTAPVVARLLAAGAAVIGKTHTDEIAFSLNGVNAHYGAPVNVNAPGRVTGGSSSGSAAAVAGNLCDFALGSDTGGSVRAPASFCGLYGIRTTHGRIPLDGACALAPSFDTVGWFARDAALMSKVGGVLLEGGASRTPSRVFMAQDGFALIGAREQAALKPAVDRVARALGAPTPVVVAPEGLGRWFDIFRTIQFAEVWKAHGPWVTRVKPRFGPDVKQRFDKAATIPRAEWDEAAKKRERIADAVASLIGDAILVLPTAPSIAPRLDAPAAEVDDFRARAMSLLCIAGLARLPQVSMPLATFDGCPLGLSIIGPRGSDEMLLAAAEKIAAA